MIILLLSLISSTGVYATVTFEEVFNEANQLFYKQDFAHALEKYREARALDASHAALHYNIGVTCFELHDYVAAEEALRMALAKNSRHSRAYAYLGKIALEQKQNDEAERFFKLALSYDPGLVDAVNPLTELLKEKLLCEDAIIYLKAAHARNPGNVQLAFNFANTLNMADHTEEALEIYLQLNERYKNDSSINYNIAYTYKKLGLLDKALPYYEKTLELKPEHCEAIFSRGLAYLMLGEWEKGWAGYEYRWKRGDHQTLRSYPEPLWQGEPLAGKHIFVYGEQGLGDTFQFIRYLKLLKEMGAYITFAPQNPLRTLLALCPYIDAITAHNERPHTFDYFIPLVSLPYIMHTRIDTVPNEIPYLYADPALEAYWHDELAKDPNFKIGICWQGNSEYSTAFLRAAVASKSAPVSLFEPLTHIPGVSVYSLQRVTGVNQLDSMPTTMKLITFGADFDASHGRFMDTAAVMKNLDLIITIDTSTCHLAAALGVEVWNLLPTPSDWRWMLNRLDTPWYPNMRLFRQPSVGDWQGLMQEVVEELITLVARTHATTLSKSSKIEYATLRIHLYAQRALIEDPIIRSLIDKELRTLEQTVTLLEQQ